MVTNIGGLNYVNEPALHPPVIDGRVRCMVKPGIRPWDKAGSLLIMDVFSEYNILIMWALHSGAFTSWRKINQLGYGQPMIWSVTIPNCGLMQPLFIFFLL